MPIQQAYAEPATNGVPDLASKLQRLRRLRTDTGASPASAHLQSALDCANQTVAAAAPNYQGIFIGIIINF